jgi:hypothetical protein
MWWNNDEEIKRLKKENTDLKMKLFELGQPEKFNPGDIVLGTLNGRTYEMYVIGEPELVTEFSEACYRYNLVSTDFKKQFVGPHSQLILVKAKQ